MQLRKIVEMRSLLLILGDPWIRGIFVDSVGLTMHARSKAACSAVLDSAGRTYASKVGELGQLGGGIWHCFYEQVINPSLLHLVA